MKNHLNDISEKALSLSENCSPVIIAIDGRCASGKTTFGELLKEKLSANLFHMDNFFLRKEQRSLERYATPGENIDHERFLSEVLLPLKSAKAFSYRPFCCKTQQLAKEIFVSPLPFAIIEGSYSHHEKLRRFYDLMIFFDVDEEVQRERLKKRNPANFGDFFDKWIPLEEKYFNCFNVKEKADFIFKS